MLRGEGKSQPVSAIMCLSYVNSVGFAFRKYNMAFDDGGRPAFRFCLPTTIWNLHLSLILVLDTAVFL